MAAENSIETKLNEACANLGRACSEKYQGCEENIRKAPVASVLFAAAAGYFISFLPIWSLLSGLTRLFLALIKPAVFLFGAIKVVEYVRAKSPSQPTEAVDPERDPVIDSPVGPV